jgi:methylase of polypeptide subunit release factors
MTALALEMNAEVLSHDGRPVVGTAAAVVVADLAAGLRRASYDLVLANPPWVPTPAGEAIVFADGGPTGCELPRRFLRDALTLLRPGGAVAMTTLDPTMQDGARPWVEAIEAMNERSTDTGVVATMFETPMLGRRPDFEARLLKNQPRLRAARHVAVVATRVDPGPDAIDGERRRLAGLRTAAGW